MTISRSDAPDFEDVMIDIETMSLHPHKALILSIGMIEFDPRPIEGLKIGNQSKIILDIVPQLLLGRRVDVGTQKFWADQPTSASSHWTEAPEHHRADEAIFLIKKFCEDKKRVWANGTQFDLSNIIGLGEDIGMSAPWHYQAPRDMRTFVRETEATRLVPIGDAIDIAGVPHDPIYDCIVQATQVWAHYREH